MKRKRHTPEQIIRKLCTAEQLLNQGQTVADVFRALRCRPRLITAGSSSMAAKSNLDSRMLSQAQRQHQRVNF